MAESPCSPGLAERNLLFGILALQLDFINRDEFVAAMNAWVLIKEKPLGQVLCEQIAIRTDQHLLLDTLLQNHLDRHGGNIEAGLAAISFVPWLHEELAKLQDRDVIASLVHLSQNQAVWSAEDRIAR